jgi:hypothetical protein
MRCEDVLAALAGRGFLGRLSARIHAAHCARCASVVSQFETIVGELAAPPALTASERRLWLQACDLVPAANSVRPRLSRLAFALAVATILTLTAAAWLRSRWNRLPTTPPIIVVVDTTAANARTLKEVEEIRLGVVALARELDQLEREASLLDARRDAETLQRRFAPRTAFND